MSRTNMGGGPNHSRRRFCGIAAMTIAAAQLRIFDSAYAQAGKVSPARVPAIRPGHTPRSLHSSRSMPAC
jgi:hypothetical protein